MKRTCYCVLIFTLFLVPFSDLKPGRIFADSVEPSQMVQGGTGLWQTPTSRMLDEGELSINYTDNDQYRFWSVSLQLFPWLETTARYTDIRTRLYSANESFSGTQTLKDKSIDAKIRLWQESFYLPELSIGFRDIGGTGLFDSEFITASKRAGPFDFHLGLGWGYLGTHDDISNPFCEVRDSFCQRPGGFSGIGGKVDYQRFFKGPVALFGGIEYQTPYAPLTIKLEYEGNNYLEDRAGALEQDSRWNVGAVYKTDNMDFSVNYQRGNTIGIGFRYHLNLHQARQVKFDSPPRALIDITPAKNAKEVNNPDLIRELAAEASFYVTSSYISDNKAVIYGNQLSYRDRDESIQRISRILASKLPSSINTYHILEGSQNEPMVETVVDARDFIVHARNDRVDADISSTYRRQAPQETTLDAYFPADSKGWISSTSLFWIQTFGSPEEFYMYQGGINQSFGYQFSSNLGLYGNARATVVTNFDEFNFTVDSLPTTLPRVRTQVREYVTGSDVYLDSLFLNYFNKIDNNLYGQFYAGHLENMFGGVGIEIMHREVDSNIAFGVDLNYVKQRDFDDRFGFLDYETFTGHASMYWQPKSSPDIRLTLSAGQFLAQDKGIHIDFAKRFDSGIIVGAYAAFTDVSSEEYGEGSFTKGFYISIPFDLFVLTPAKGRGTIPWIPIGRDGGQMLRRPSKLINKTELLSPFID